MKQDRAIGFALVVLLGVSGALLAAPGQGRGFTGTPADIINVKVTNRPNEPMPVVVQDFNLPTNYSPLRVDVGKPTIQVEIKRQQWEYKQVRVMNLEDATPILTAEGTQGWETTGVSFASPGGTVLVLKRIK